MSRTATKIYDGDYNRVLMGFTLDDFGRLDTVNAGDERDYRSHK